MTDIDRTFYDCGHIEETACRCLHQHSTLGMPQVAEFDGGEICKECYRQHRISTAHTTWSALGLRMGQKPGPDLEARRCSFPGCGSPLA